MTLSCTHSFHVSCFCSWYSVKKSCPVCKTVCFVDHSVALPMEAEIPVQTEPPDVLTTSNMCLVGAMIVSIYIFCVDAPCAHDEDDILWLVLLIAAYVDRSRQFTIVFVLFAAAVSLLVKAYIQSPCVEFLRLFFSRTMSCLPLALSLVIGTP